MAAPRAVVWALIVIPIFVLGELYAFTRSKETKALVFRFHFVLLLQTIFFLIGRIFWVNASASWALIASRKLRAIMKVTTILYLTVAHLSYASNLFFISKEPHLISLMSYACLGSFIQLTFCLVILISCAYLFKAFYAIFNKGQKTIKTTDAKYSQDGIHAKEHKINLVPQILRPPHRVLIAIAYSVIVTMYGLHKASLPPGIKPVDITLHKLPKSMNGMTFVQISDIHLGPTVGFSKMLRIVNMVNQLHPDVVVLTGDLVDGSVARLHEAAEPLRLVKAKYGKYYVTGNHEYYTGDVDNWLKHVEKLGFTALHNSHHNIHSKQQPMDHICMAGVDDPTADIVGYGDHGVHLDKAVAPCDPSAPIILLAHQPKVAKKALDSKYDINLVLSGHTHGGQMFPIMIGVYILNPFFVGLYQYGEHGQVYVSPGTVYWGIPMRVGTSMEITHITLKSPP